ncbi:hypothetical protein [Natronorubrum aibiense]|uniref:hypothetical protein n=1 Tax=Natronorubrum aibiense TaxID=348826 RepID=UPI0018784EBC
MLSLYRPVGRGRRLRGLRVAPGVAVGVARAGTDRESAAGFAVHSEETSEPTAFGGMSIESHAT